MPKEKIDYVLSEDMKKKLGYVCLHTASIYPTYRDFKLTDFCSELVSDNTAGSDFHVMTFTSPDVNGTYLQIQVAFSQRGITHYLVAFLSHPKKD